MAQLPGDAQRSQNHRPRLAERNRGAAIANLEGAGVPDSRHSLNDPQTEAEVERLRA